MKKFIIGFMIGAGIAIAGSIIAATILVSNKEEYHAEVPKISHAQEVWIYALEYCESRGVVTAVNKVNSSREHSEGMQRNTE